MFDCISNLYAFFVMGSNVILFSLLTIFKVSALVFSCLFKPFIAMFLQIKFEKLQIELFSNNTMALEYSLRDLFQVQSHLQVFFTAK